MYVYDQNSRSFALDSDTTLAIFDNEGSIQTKLHSFKSPDYGQSIKFRKVKPEQSQSKKLKPTEKQMSVMTSIQTPYFSDNDKKLSNLFALSTKDQSPIKSKGLESYNKGAPSIQENATATNFINIGLRELKEPLSSDKEEEAKIQSPVVKRVGDSMDIEIKKPSANRNRHNLRKRNTSSQCTKNRCH